MGKVDRQRSALGNHARQREQAHLILCGWRAVEDGAVHDAYGLIVKRHGECMRWLAGSTATECAVPCEWDELRTNHVHWLYRVIARKGWL